MAARGARLIAALLAVQVVAVGCGTTSAGTMEVRVGDMPGVARVNAWSEPGDGLPFIFQDPMHLEVVMDAHASSDNILDVVEAYEGALEDGVVERLELSLRGAARVTLETGGGVSEEMVDDLVATRGGTADGTAVTRYRVKETNLGRRVDLTLASGGLNDALAAAERYRRIEGVHLVAVKRGRFVLMVDDTVWDAELTEARIDFIRQVKKRFNLHTVNIGYPHLMTLWVDVADVVAVRRLLETHGDLGYADVQAHQPAARPRSRPGPVEAR